MHNIVHKLLNPDCWIHSQSGKDQHLWESICLSELPFCLSFSLSLTSPHLPLFSVHSSLFLYLLTPLTISQHLCLLHISSFPSVSFSALWLQRVQLRGDPFSKRHPLVTLLSEPVGFMGHGFCFPLSDSMPGEQTASAAPSHHSTRNLHTQINKHPQQPPLQTDGFEEWGKYYTEASLLLICVR